MISENEKKAQLVDLENAKLQIENDISIAETRLWKMKDHKRMIESEIERLNNA